MNISARFCLWGAVLLLTACQPSGPSTELYQQQLFTFGTLVDISILSDKPQQARQAINDISTEFELLHKRWHPWKNGALGQLNKNFAAGDSTPVSSDKSIVAMIQASQILSQKSNGLFNPAIGRLIKLWQFDQLETESYQFSPPAPDKIHSLLQKKPQMQDIIIDNGQVTTTNPAVILDFGAFAKGVAIEQMMQRLAAQGINNALLNAGGDLKVLGRKNDRPWRIGIKNPASAQDSTQPAIIAALNLNNNEALFTSGNYERFFEFQGKQYHHIIDPRSGYPARGTRSVTVLTEDAALADAASTALFIAGPELWPEIAEKMGIKYVMLIGEDNKIYLTPAMAKRIELFTDVSPIIVN